MGSEAVPGKEWQEMLVPYPCAHVGAMHAQQRDRMGLACGITADNLEFHLLTVRRDGI